MNKFFRIITIVYCVISTICIDYLFRGSLDAPAQLRNSNKTQITGATSIKVLISKATTSPTRAQAPEFKSVKSSGFSSMSGISNSTNPSTLQSLIAIPTIAARDNNNTGSNNDSYDKKIKGLDQVKLGFAFKPEFQKIPNSCQQILFDRKQKIRQKSAGKPITKIILIYGSPEWLNYINPSNSSRNINPEFKCKYINYEPFSGKNSASIRDSLEALARNSDAVVLPVTRHLNRELWDVLYNNKISIYNKNRSLPVTKIEDASKKTKTGDARLAIPKLIHFTLESPAYASNFIRMKIRKKNRPRDLLASFWRGSDIYIPYFRWQYYNNNIRSIPQERNYAEGRTKMAAVVVSNCGSPNNRLGLVRQLKKYLSVDIYGACGVDMKIDCRKADCFELIKKNYKFYLAFENSNCRDYITEKLYRNALGNDLLPIVYGAHPSDYKAIAPNNSYIHVEDFESVEKLGFYLHTLDKNDTLYNNYFAWKGTGTFSETDKEHSSLSEVCAYLHANGMKVDANANPKPKNTQASGINTEYSEKPIIPYFNEEDKYNFTKFCWSTDDERLCLKTGVMYWNR